MVRRKRGEEREMGGGLGRAVAGAFSLAAHLPYSLRRASPFRCERSEQAESPVDLAGFQVVISFNHGGNGRQGLDLLWGCPFLMSHTYRSY